MSAIASVRELMGKKTATDPKADKDPAWDPVIGLATVNKNTLLCGFSPNGNDIASVVAKSKAKMTQAIAEYEANAVFVRQYADTYRTKYQARFGFKATTVKIPYSTGPDATNHQWVSVVFTNRYSVQRDQILQNKAALGSDYDRLFRETKTLTLKPEGLTVIRKLLKEAGCSDEEIPEAMKVLFEEETTVSASLTYEDDIKEASPEAQTICSQFVKRDQPGLRF